MLELYHWEPNGACARALICLHEKHLAFTSHYAAGGEVPLLVRKGREYSDATSITEYLETTYPDIMLMPHDPREREEVQTWEWYVDESIAPAVSELAWAAYGARAIERDPRVARAREETQTALRKTEATLANAPWLVGASYSLADIAVFSYFNYLPHVTPSLMSEALAPRTSDWLRRIGSRPAVKAALAMARTPDPFTVAAPRRSSSG